LEHPSIAQKHVFSFRARSNGPAAQASPESHHFWLDPRVRDRWETSARRYHQADKQGVEYFTLCVGH
jgi:hypothetical protein